jgi:Tol biopolymer transport system component
MALDPARDSAEIWTMAADGSDQTRLLPVVETGIDFSLPAWSPDGAQIAYTRWKNKGGAPINLRDEEQTASIWTMAADGSNARMIVEGAPNRAWIPTWSPDGQWIAYTLLPNTAPAPAAGVQPEPNAAPGIVGPPSAAAGAELWLVHPDGTGPRQLTSGRGDSAAAAWSPDGRQIAFNSSVNGGTSDIHVATVSDAGLTDERALVADPANDWSPTWSPDGTRLAFSSDRTGNDEIWTVAIDGTGLTRLTDNSDGDWVPTWSVDGSRIVFVADRNGDVDIWSMAADGTDQRDLTNSPGTDDGRWSVAVSPTGRLAYTSAAYRTGAASSWVREDFAAAVTILWGIFLAVVALLLVALGAPLGGFTIALTLLVALAAAPSDQWRFLPAAIIGGIVVDVLVRGSPLARRARVAATALPLVGVLAIGLTLSLAGTAAWSVTLLLGVAAAVALLGWGLAEAVRRLAPAEA